MPMRRLLPLVALLLTPAALPAQDEGSAPMSPAFLRAMEPMVPRDAASARVVTTQARITLNGRPFAYRAIVTEQPMPGADGAPVAVAVSYAYVADRVGDAAKRPVLFLFNGGPGASSSPLHMQAFGPRRMVGTGDAAHLEDNRFTLLDIADLVFIDPVGTGASMPVAGRDASPYFGVGGDARGVASMIERWLAANGRTASPVLLVGESYGTARALAILNETMAAKKPLPDGVVLLSSAIGDSDGPVVSDAVLFPTLAAVAWYHGAVDRAGQGVAAWYDAALHFAQTDYAAALMQGASLPAADKARIAARMAAFTGLPAATIMAKNLRLERRDFMLGLLADKGLRTGQLDGRATRALADSRLRPPFDDPSMSLGMGTASLIERYLKDDLGYAVPSAYRSLNLGINFKWSWDKEYGGSYRAAAFAPYLTAAMAAKPTLRLFAAGGYYDITTPVYAGQFAIEQQGVPAGRATFRRYAAGHSAFEDVEALAALSGDLHRFVEEVVAAR
ncbi:MULTISPECIES: S10 family serine carboxypeptidase-like protein [unclassified Sphingomonas]|uniref:S10 family serine carboxypeptidase-like protein n=1 Tax=unclassified Sphingomonas TaxID=196159 RepID=UPI001F15B668|nr:MULTISPECIES: peptidase S10 [unclassified Sphingomonas]